MDQSSPASFDADLPRDIATIEAQSWPRRDLDPPPRGRRKGFQVVFQRGVLDAIHAHGKSITDIEICGFLVGNVFHDDHGPFLHVTGSIEGRHATHHTAQVTFTSATWDYAHEVLDREHPGGRIVGWYHTHPDFGVFLSGMDLFIQDNFFNLPWQVALVYDPIREEEALFVWRNAVSERMEHLVHNGGWIGADGEAADPPATQPPAAEAEQAPGGDGADAAPADDGSADQPRVSLFRRCLRAVDRFFDE